ncbi:MAG: hypothetical protein IT342_26320 [Candidatus Melainabacteria bacterium]|nr:hypothetical protein [Candidatus Melainabacteria bacterium]
MKNALRKIPIFVLIVSSLYFFTDLAFGAKEMGFQEWANLLNSKTETAAIEKVELKTGIRSIFGGTVFFIKRRGDLGTKFVRVPEQSVQDSIKTLRALKIPVFAVDDALFVFACFSFILGACSLVLQWTLNLRRKQ